MTKAIRRPQRKALWLVSVVCLSGVGAAQLSMPRTLPSAHGQDGKDNRDKRLSPPIV